VSVTSGAGQAGLLLVPFAVLFVAWVVVPVRLTRRGPWSASSRSFAALAAVAGLVFVLASASAADAAPGGGAVGPLGTDVPVLLVPPLVLAALAEVAGGRSARRRG
jgi:hypothetical protein